MIQKHTFGTLSDGRTVESYQIIHTNGISASVMNLGCTLLSVEFPTQNGRIDVCLGYDTPQEYIDRHTSMGAVCGRFANRIAKGQFELNGISYQLPVNSGPNHLHGGVVGYAYRLWNAEIVDEHAVRFTRISPNGEESYPGTVRLAVTYTLDDDNGLSIQYDAVSDADTILNLTNHSYWNLNGYASGDAMQHTLKLPASFFCACDENALVTGEICAVSDTPFDFRKPTPISSHIAKESENEQLQRGSGFDHCYLLDGQEPVVLTGDQSGISMEITTDMPAIQLYTANHLHQQSGKNGASYFPRCSVCLETEQVPDAPNKPQFPSAVLKANEPFTSITRHQFVF